MQGQTGEGDTGLRGRCRQPLGHRRQHWASPSSVLSRMLRMSASSSVSSSGCWATCGCTHWTWGSLKGESGGCPHHGTHPGWEPAEPGLAPQKLAGTPPPPPNPFLGDKWVSRWKGLWRRVGVAQSNQNSSSSEQVIARVQRGSYLEFEGRLLGLGWALGAAWGCSGLSGVVRIALEPLSYFGTFFQTIGRPREHWCPLCQISSGFLVAPGHLRHGDFYVFINHETLAGSGTSCPPL